MSTLRSLAVVALVLFAARTEAQVDHHLGAGTGGGCETSGETTEDIHVDSVDASCGSGVASVDPNWFEYMASADSASGHINVTGLVSVTDPPASFNPNNHVSTAFIGEKLTPTAPGPIRAMLQISPGIEVGGTVVRYEVTLQLTTSCTAFLAQYVGNGFVEDPDIVLSCPDYVGSATGDLNTLTVTLDDPQSTIDLGAQVRAEWFSFGSYPPTGGEYAINANLWVLPLEGAEYTAPSPNFLTQVPEPGASALGWVAIGVLGTISRKRS